MYICCRAPCCGAVAAERACSYGTQRRRLHAAVDRYQGAQQQTRRPPLLLSIDGSDGRTDKRTLDRFIDTAPHTRPTVWAVSTTCWRDHM